MIYILEYTTFKNFTKVTFLDSESFSYSSATVRSRESDRDEVLRDAYILAKNQEGVPYGGNAELSDLEVYELSREVSILRIEDPYTLKVAALDQYGDPIELDVDHINWTIHGTNLAEVKGDKLVEYPSDTRIDYKLEVRYESLREYVLLTIYPIDYEVPPEESSVELKDIEDRQESLHKLLNFTIDTVSRLERSIVDLTSMSQVYGQMIQELILSQLELQQSLDIPISEDAVMDDIDFNDTTLIPQDPEDTSDLSSQISDSLDNMDLSDLEDLDFSDLAGLDGIDFTS